MNQLKIPNKRVIPIRTAIPGCNPGSPTILERPFEYNFAFTFTEAPVDKMALVDKWKLELSN